jgi:hypothetical protein
MREIQGVVLQEEHRLVCWRTQTGVLENTDWCAREHRLVCRRTQTGVLENTDWCAREHRLVC